MKEIDQVLRSKELELSHVEIEVQSLRIVAELLGEEADQEEARNARHSLDVASRRRETRISVEGFAMREDMQSLVKPLRPRLHLWVHDAQSTGGYIFVSRAH